MVRAVLTYAFLAVYIFVGALIGVPWTWITGDVSLLYSISRRGALTALQLSGVKLRIIHPERARKHPTCVFVCNHISNLDPAALFGILPRISVILKQELRRIPILGYVMSLGSFVYVDRRNPDSRKQALEDATNLLRSGISLLVFPEGTRSKDGRMLPFRPGPFTMAIESGAAVVPLTIHGTRELMPKGGFGIRPGTVTITFEEPIVTTGMGHDDRSALMDQARRAMQETLDADLRVG